MAKRRAWFARVHHHRHRVRITPVTWQGWVLFLTMLAGGIGFNRAIGFAAIEAGYSRGAVVALHVVSLLVVLAIIITTCWRLSERIDPPQR